ESPHRIERKVQVKPDRDRTVGRGFTGQCYRHRIQPANVTQARSAFFDGGVICDGALPIDIFGSGPIGRELGHLEASFWRNLKGGGSSQSDFADPAASKHIETHVI